MSVKKSTKVGAAKSEYRLFVEFKKEYQHPRASFNYYSNLGKTSDFQLRSLKRRVLHGTVKDRYTRARLYRESTGECLAVWLAGLAEMSATDYHRYTRESFQPQQSQLHAYVICQRAYQEILRVNKLSHPLTIFGNDGISMGKENSLADELKNLLTILLKGKLKGKFAKTYIYDRQRDVKVAELNLGGAVTYLDPQFEREVNG